MLDKNYLSSSICKVGELDNIKSIFAFKKANDKWYLDHLWLSPEVIGRGYGKLTFEEIRSTAAAHNISTLLILPDPGAEEFYLKVGAAFTGNSVPSRIADGPTFNEMVYTFIANQRVPDIVVDNEINLSLFDPKFSRQFFNSIHENPSSKDPHRLLLRKKYHHVSEVTHRIHDAIANKFLLDGTPDFFIFFNGKLAGVFEFHPLQAEDHLEIGFLIFEEYRGLDLICRVFRVMKSYARQNFQIKRIIASTELSNLPSQKTSMKCGFQQITHSSQASDANAEEEIFFEFKFTN